MSYRHYMAYLDCGKMNSGQVCRFKSCKKHEQCRIIYKQKEQEYIKSLPKNYYPNSFENRRGRSIKIIVKQTSPLYKFFNE